MLFGSTVLEVIIGMIFVYLLLSLLCSAVAEYIESLLGYRASDLRKGIELLLNDSPPTAGSEDQTEGSKDQAEQGVDLAQRLYEHGLIRPLYRSPNKLPSYIPSRTFALALWNMAGGGAGGSGTTNLEDIKKTINASVPNKELKEALITLIDDAKGDFNQARKNIEDWYEGMMDRVSGWYKRRVHAILLVIGLLTAAFINADSINIAKALVSDDVLRGSISNAAETYLESAKPTPEPTPCVPTPQAPCPQPQPTPPPQTAAEKERAAREKVKVAKAQLDELGLPLGWVSATSDNKGDLRRMPEDGMGWLLKVLGLILTGLAISQGAPFWFDLLNKFMVIRSTVKPKEKSQEQPSKDKPAPETETGGGNGDDGAKG